ncbi:MAG: UvrD-helicase domain-containing protein [Halothiobacillaceae bacterium]
MTLNPRQAEAVTHVDSPLLVLAGAGSGKTRVITEKIAHLVRAGGYRGRDIHAVTFTNKAAREMRERITGLLDKSESRGLNVSTFHTLGLNMLRQDHPRLGLRKGFTVLDADDSQAMLRELAGNLGLSNALDLKQARNRISLWKNDFINPEQAAQTQVEDALAEQTARLYAEYERQLRACNALDFDDLIVLPVRLLQTDAEARERWQNRVRYLLVDEYQDTNTTQYELVRLLVGVQGRLTAVGDDHQSVYAWRGARPENLMRLAQDFPGLRLIKLEQNYRSVNSVLRAANHLIRNNPGTFEKNLWSEHGPGDPLRVLVCEHAEDEVQRIASEILHHKFRVNARYRDYAILYRGNHQARLIEGALRQLNIPYVLTGGQSFFERAEIKDAMGYLRLLANPDDDAAFLRVVNTPRREIGPTTLERLGGYAHDRGVSLYAAAGQIGLQTVLDERARQRLTHFTSWLDTIRTAARRQDPVTAIEELLTAVDYPHWLRENSPSPKAAERRWQNVRDWIDWLRRMQEDAEGGMGLSDLAARMSLMGILERQEEDSNPDAVALMTLHAAKGLEFPHVYMAGMEEELLPHRESLDGDRLEEERRLCYVGITRAQRSLTFTLARRRKRYGEWQRCTPSRFLDELPEDLLEWQGVGIEVPEQERKQRGRESLAQLKAMLHGE